MKTPHSVFGRVMAMGVWGLLLASVACAAVAAEEEDPGQLMTQLKAAQNTRDTNRFIHRLAKLGPAAVPHLLEALDDPNAEFRGRVLDVLSRTHAPRDAIHPAVLKYLQTEKAPLLRRRAVRSIRGYGKAAPTLLTILQDEDEEYQVRVEAARGLGQIADPRSLPGLLAGLKIENKRVRATVVAALSKFKDPRVIPALTERLKNDPAWGVRLGVPLVLSATGSRDVLPALMAALGDPNSRVRTMACSGIARLRHLLRHEEVLGLLSHAGWEQRRLGVTLLLLDRKRKAVPLLAAATKDKIWGVRWSAVNALCVFPFAEVQAPVAACLHDENRAVRQAAIRTLGLLKDKSAIAKLKPFLTDKDSWIRESAARAIEQLEK